MMSEIFHFVDWVVGMFVAVIAWIGKKAHDRIDQLERSLNDHRVHIASHYPTKEDFQEVKASLFRIENKLDNKADKQGH
jgi:hypothetical protein